MRFCYPRDTRRILLCSLPVNQPHSLDTLQIMSHTPTVVAVVDTNPDLVRIMRMSLEKAASW